MFLKKHWSFSFNFTICLTKLKLTVFRILVFYAYNKQMEFCLSAPPHIPQTCPSGNVTTSSHYLTRTSHTRGNHSSRELDSGHRVRVYIQTQVWGEKF